MSSFDVELQHVEDAYDQRNARAIADSQLGQNIDNKFEFEAQVQAWLILTLTPYSPVAAAGQ